MAYTTSQILGWAKTSQALAAIGEAKKKFLTINNVDEDLHIKLYLERSILQYEYDQDPASDNLFLIGNYVLALCGVYLFPAMVASGNGGSALNPSVPTIGYIYTEIKKTVDGASGSPVSGSFTYQDNNLIGGTQLNFIIVNKITEFVGDDFTFDSGTGTITRTNQWQTGDVVVIPFNKPV